MGVYEPFPVVARRNRWTQSAEVAGAYDNLFTPENVNGAYPAPCAAGNAKIVATTATGTKLYLQNYATNQALFSVMVLHQNNIFNPLMCTQPQASGGLFMGSSANNLALLEVYGPNPWGFWQAENQVNQGTGVISVLDNSGGLSNPQNIQPHKWVFVLQPAPDGGSGENVTIIFVLPPEITITVNYRTGYTGAWSSRTLMNGGGIQPIVSATNNELLELNINVVTPNFDPFTLGCWVDTAASGEDGLTVRMVNSSLLVPFDYPQWIYNLGPMFATTINEIIPLCGTIRNNCSRCIVTNVVAGGFSGGNMQIAKITASDAPQLDYQSYLFSLPHSYLSNLKRGVTSCWWSKSKDLTFRTPASFEINPLASPNVSVNMILLSNVNVITNTGSNDTMPLQFKYDSWIDYQTSFTTIGAVEIVNHNDEWATIMSYIAKEYMFCDNPDHKKMLAHLKEAVKFMMSGDPRAEAIRKAALSLGSAGLSYAGRALAL